MTRLDVIKHRAERIMGIDQVHGWGHIQRVMQFAEHIKYLSRDLQVNWFVVKAAIYLHDIGRYIKDYEVGTHTIGPNVTNHAEKSFHAAWQILKELEKHATINGTEGLHILRCIRTHSVSNGREPESIEAYIVSDADKLDAIGSSGIYRLVKFERNLTDYKDIVEAMVKHSKSKLLNIYDQLHTNEAKAIGLPRHHLLVVFIEQLERELRRSHLPFKRNDTDGIELS